MSKNNLPLVLIIEDGNEYYENLSRFVKGPEYLQVKNGLKAIEVLKSKAVDIVYLDMRFDRIEKKDLLGDYDKVAKDHNDDPLRTLRFIQNNQGLFILEEIKKNGFSNIPVVLAYDFSREEKRFLFLKKNNPSLTWVKDAVTPLEIKAIFDSIV
ncbi:MAG: hypothetical protein JXR91_16170 [Deltaproteobacteria bacterium]|nr:hypothetical protein [Deltaproteobacteria bacterium]